MIPNTFSLSKFLLIAFNFFLLNKEFYRKNKNNGFKHEPFHLTLFSQFPGIIFLKLCLNIS
ncbi:hypothetical protein B1B04_17410 [Lysinibacillus sp. KCTC 33748]|nr:hypothetical protein B1B04_17410 [Lysinibacillus sp. KCTC 33748]